MDDLVVAVIRLHVIHVEHGDVRLGVLVGRGRPRTRSVVTLACKIIIISKT